MVPSTSDRPRVVILGGGFGGLYAARALKKAPVQLTLLDRRNHHLFQPLLYQVATAALNPSEIASPIRALVRGTDARVLLGEAVSVDASARRVRLGDGTGLDYDFLIVATGATHSYFGQDGWARFAPGLKSLEDALEIRRRVLLAFERAEREPDPVRRRALMTFVIIGAGPTGVELAGALAEIARHALASDFRNIDSTQSRILLLEGMDQVLPSYPGALPEHARRSLQRLGVEVRTGARVTGIDAGGVFLGLERIDAATVLWAAGVAASPLGKTLGAPLDRAGRVQVTERLTVPGQENVFVIGDLAALQQDGKPVPGVAPAAMQQGLHTAQNIQRALGGQPLLPFRYRDKGSFSVIGRGSAVGLFFGVPSTGLVAWLAWLFIHLMFLIGFRSRAVVLIQWAWSFVTLGRSARLITYDSEAHAREAPLAPPDQPPKAVAEAAAG